MAEIFEIKGTEDTPEIVFSKSTCSLSVKGKSLPEDAVAFYQPVLEWMNSYTKENPETTLAEFRLEYFNTSSSKQLFKLISLLKDLSLKKPVTIKWYYDKGDKDMQLSGERFSKLCQMPIETIQS